MDIRLKRTPGLYLVGFMGSGKSTVGALVAGRLGWSFVDLDEEIERAEGATIAAIFAGRGEAAFRRLESEALRERVRAVARGQPAVIALGGGAFAQPANALLLENNGVTVWLDCPLELAWERVRRAEHRPLAQDREQFGALYRARLPFYAKADYRVAIEGDDPAPAVAGILALPVFL